jgi:hypothetical protein
MNKTGQMEVGALLLVGIVIIVGAVLLQASAQNVGDVINKIDVTENISVVPAYVSNTSLNESIPLSLSNEYASTDWRYTDCPMTGFTASLTNGTALTLTTDYLFTDTGILYLKDTAKTDLIVADAGTNKTLVTYTYCPSTYDNNAGGRTMSTLIIIFFALAIAGIALYPVLKNKFD